MSLSNLLARLPRVVSAAEMAAVDKYAIETLGLPGRVLMENAGRACFAAIRDRWQPLAGKRAVVFCGKGNNGGDGFVVSRLLQEAGVACDTYLLGKAEDLRGDALANFQLMGKLGYSVHTLQQGGAMPDLSQPDFVIDALLGTGVHGALRGFLAQLVELINQSQRPVVSVDLPTGMNADTGEVEGPCIRAAMTVTFGARKSGLLFSPGREFVGNLSLADIGFPAAAYEQLPDKGFLLEGPALAEWLPQRQPDAFKNRVGQILVIAGSRGFGGAARMTATAALRAGAGLVVLAAPESLLPALEAATAEVIKLSLPEEDGAIAPGAFEHIKDRLSWADVVAMGPGLGTSAGVAEIVRQVLATFGGTIVIDADGLNVLEGDTQAIRACKGHVILTPHPGELNRLTGLDKFALKSAPIVSPRRIAGALGHTLVVKGAPTVVALPAGEVLVNSTGNAGMATAGSGDVLTGLIAGLAGQGLQPGLAAGLGVYLHGLAGDQARNRLGTWGLIAGDILDCIPEAFLRTANLDPS